jgi:hypothetical protein
MTRKAMQTTMRKVEHEREEFAKRSAQVNEEALNLRRQVEGLPILI